MSYLIYTLFFSTFLISLFLIVNYRNQIGKYLNVLDKPTTNKIHTEITPLIGALPIFLHSVIIFIFYFLHETNSYVITTFTISYFFLVLGYIDDKYNLNAYIKLFVSLIFLYLILQNYEILTIKFLYFETFQIKLFLGNFSIFFSILCILLLMNALNLTDGINGLASLIKSFWFFFIFIYSSTGFESHIYFILSLLIFINTFFIYKGKYFLGDSGTLYLSSLFSVSFIYIYNLEFQSQNIISVEKIFILFMMPGIDMLRLFITRIINNRDPFSGDLNHLHHILFNYFGTTKSLIIYIITFLITNLASYLNIVSPIIIISAYILIYIIFIKKHKNLNFIKIK